MAYGTYAELNFGLGYQDYDISLRAWLIDLLPGWIMV
jgi:hypothetical protein